MGEGMNGFFQVFGSDKGTELRIFPPREGGCPVEIGEVLEYLGVHNIIYDLPALNAAVNAGAAEAKTVLLNADPVVEERESYKLTISPDNMTASVRFYPQSSGGERMTEQEFLNDLKYKKIVFGVEEAAVKDFFHKRCYCTDIVVARGKAPRHGADARIEYYFNTDLKVHPELKEDGSVDFFNLNTINHCHAGEVLARLFPEDPGDPGINLYGEKIKPRDVKRETLKFGRNILLSEDKREITAEVDGHVTLVEGKVFVSDLLEEENVDNSTGNIEYDGSVQINGNVCMNFSIKAKGNIEVRGVVEGAYLEAGGDIIIARGMNGMGRGVLKAGGNIIAKFLENTNATAGGYISTESILHSTAFAGTEINVTGKRGFITGGHVCATNAINVKTLGSAMGADTIVEVGADPHIKQQIQKLQKEIAEADKSVKSIQPILSNVQTKLSHGVKLPQEQVKYLQSLLQASKQKTEEIKNKTEEINKLMETLNGSQNAKIVVSGEVHPGTKVCIADVSMVVKKGTQHCKFVKSGGDVKMSPI